MFSTNGLVPWIDNGGQRSYIERRRHPNIYFLWERRSKKDRRKIADRREIPNQRRGNGPERRVVFLK